MTIFANTRRLLHILGLIAGYGAPAAPRVEPVAEPEPALAAAGVTRES